MARDIEVSMWKLGTGCKHLPKWARPSVGKDIRPGDGCLTVHTPEGPVRLTEGDFLFRVPGEARLFYMTGEDIKAGLEARDKRPLRPIGSASAANKVH